VVARAGHERSFMSGSTFLDSNILVYAFDRDAPAKQEVALSLLEGLGAAGRLVLSTQVLQEFYVVTTRKLSQPLDPAEAEAAIEFFVKYPVVRIDESQVLAAIRRNREDSASFWDALIIESALTKGCDELLTEDLQHGRQYGSMTVRNPFESLESAAH
jgi:predicted nucleic acid-binding protein